MKKILYFSFLFLMLFCFVSNIKAATFYEGDYISGDYVKKEKNGIVKYKQSKFIRLSGSGKAVYCIEPFTILNTNVDYTDVEEINELSSSTLQRLSLLAYYGYGYNDEFVSHNENKWYSITQNLIQMEADKDADVYFTDKLNGLRIEKYTNEISELQRLVNNHFIKPSFNNQTFKILKGDTITINDSNQVLNKFNIISFNNNFDIKKDNNSLTIKAKNVSNTTINLSKNDNYNNENPLIYKSTSSQDIISSGKMINVNSKINIESFTGSINVVKHDFDNKSCQAQGEASLRGSIYSVYDENKKLLKDIIIDDNCNTSIDNLSAGTYFIKEKEAGNGYELDDKEYKVTLNTNTPNQTLTLYDKVIKTEISINKNYGNKIKGDYKKEEDAKFNIINKDNNIVGNIITDNLGYGSITLPFGKYILKEISGLKNYEFIEDINIDVNKSLGNKIDYNLYNFEKTFNVKIYKIDSYTNKLIRNNPATFVIYDILTQKYLLNKDNTIYFKTDNNGIISLKNLSISCLLKNAII